MTTIPTSSTFLHTATLPTTVQKFFELANTTAEATERDRKAGEVPAPATTKVEVKEEQKGDTVLMRQPLFQGDEV